MMNKLDNMIYDSALIGYAYNGIIKDKNGIITGYCVLESNSKFKEITGLTADSGGKNVYGHVKNIKKTCLDSLDCFSRVVQNNLSETIEKYSAKSDRWFRINVIPDNKDNFVTLYTDITEQKRREKNENELLNLTITLLQVDVQKLDYQHLTEVLCKLSGASYGVFNRYSSDKKKFRNVAIAGDSKLVSRAYRYLGFSLVNKEWDTSPVRLKEIKGGTPVKFKDLNEVSQGVIPEILCNKISQLFNLGPFHVVEIRAHGKVYGDFILIFEKGKDLINQSIVTSYANLIGIAFERRSTEKRIVSSESNLKNFFDTGIDFNWVLDENGNILTINETVRKKLGYTDSELIGRSVLSVHPESRREEAASVIKSMLGGNDIPCNIPLLTKSGSLIPVETYVNKGVWDGKPVLFGISRDISALKLSEEKFYKAFNTSPNLMGISTLDTGVYIEVNQSFCDILGFSQEEIIGRKSIDVIRFDENQRALLSKMLKEKGSLRNRETVIYTKTGKPVTINLSAEVIYIQDIPYNLTVAVDITDRSRAEEELKKAHHLLEQTGLMSKTGAWEIDVTNNKIYWSDTTKKIVGVPLEYNPDMETVADFYAPGESRERILNLVKNAIDHGESFDEEFQVLSDNGKERWIRNIVQPWMKDGKCYRLVGTFQDITERKTAEATLRASEKKYRLLFESMAQGVLFYTAGAEITDANPAALKMLGMKLEDIKGKSLADPVWTVIREDGTPFPVDERPVILSLNTGKPVLDVMMGIFNPVEERFIWITVNAIPEFSGDESVPFRVYSTLNDITSRRESEIQLRYQADLRELLIELSSGFINLPLREINVSIVNSLKRIGEFVGADRAYIISYDFTSMTCSNTFEWCRDGILRQKDFLKTVPFNNSFIWMQKHLNGELAGSGNLTDAEVSLFKQAYSHNDIESFLTIPLMMEGSCTGFVGFDSVSKAHNFTGYEKQLLQVYAQTLDNITERIQIEEKLIAAKEKAEESDRLKTAFLENMSHEIRTPMSGILGFLELLKEQDLSNEIKSSYINTVTLSGMRLLSTINDIIEISKIEAGEQIVKMSAVNISSLMTYFFNFFKPQTDSKNLVFNMSNRITDSKFSVITDKSKVESIITNLLKNAIKFTSRGYIEFGNYLEDSKIVFYVKDTGTGIHKERLGIIFDRFVQADVSKTRTHEGSGLGLSIVKAYIGMLNGKIWIESETGKGSTFYFSLPLIKSGEIELPLFVSNDLPVSFPENKTILIVEDDFANFLFLQKILLDNGFSVLHTTGGLETIRLVRENSSVSLILMDLKIPELSGVEATKRIREFNTSIPIIAQTAYAFSKDRETALEAGINDYLTKPLNRKDLLSVISKYLK